MADGLDRFDNGGSGGGGFVMGLLAGTVIGAGLGMLFAPKAGAQLRSQLSEQAGNLANTASQGYRKATENAGQWAEQVRDVASELAEKGKDIYGTVREAANDAKGTPLTAATLVAGSSRSDGGHSELHSDSIGASRRS